MVIGGQIMAADSSPQVVGRFQVVASGASAGFIKIDTATGQTWRLYAIMDEKDKTQTKDFAWKELKTEKSTD